MRLSPIVLIIISTLTLLQSASAGIEYTVTSASPGEVVTISGKGASPESDIYVSISFRPEVDIIGSSYSYKISGIYIPPENHRFDLTAYPVDELKIDANPGWLPASLTSKGQVINNKGTLSKGHIIVPAKYNIRIYGKALQDNNKVHLDITTVAKIKSDPGGNFVYTYDTDGLPSGTYRVNIAGIEKILNLESVSETVSNVATPVQGSDSISASSGQEVKSAANPGTSGPESVTTEPQVKSGEIAATPEATPGIETTSEKPVPEGTESGSLLQRLINIIIFWI